MCFLWACTEKLCSRRDQGCALHRQPNLGVLRVTQVVLDLKAWRGHGERPRLSLCDRSTRVPEESPSRAIGEGAAQRQQEIPAFWKCQERQQQWSRVQQEPGRWPCVLQKVEKWPKPFGVAQSMVSETQTQGIGLFPLLKLGILLYSCFSVSWLFSLL